MSSIPTVLTCPFGHKCEEIRDGAIHRCHLYQNLKGQHPETKETIETVGCALAHVPLLLTTLGRETYKTSQAIAKFNNEMVDQNNQLLSRSTPLLGDDNG